MGWLKKVGQILAKVLQVAGGLGPILQPPAGQVLGVLEQVYARIIEIEALGVAWGLDGAKKLEAVMISATQIFLNSAMMIGKEIKDPVMFKAGVAEVIGGMVKILNSAKEPTE